MANVEQQRKSHFASPFGASKGGSQMRTSGYGDTPGEGRFPSSNGNRSLSGPQGHLCHRWTCLSTAWGECERVSAVGKAGAQHRPPAASVGAGPDGTEAREAFKRDAEPCGGHSVGRW